MSKPAKVGSLFISFEGGEGAGKTTLISKLKAALEAQEFSLLVTREPGSTSIGEQIRSLLLDHSKQAKVAAKTEVLLFLAARAQHIEEVIAPALAAGKIVLCDRFNDSTIAYQGFARGLGMAKMKKWCEDVCDGLNPDITLFLDIDPALGMARAIRQGRVVDRMETEELAFHEKVRQGFLKIAEEDTERVIVIDAGQPAEQVFQTAFAAIQNKLANSNNAY